MILRSLSLLNYRNLESSRLTFTAGLTGLVGGNAQGKTNLLEAIFLVLTGVLEAARVETVIRLGEGEAFVGAELERADGLVRLEAGLARGRRVARVDGVRLRTAEVARRASAVWIRPEDGELVLGPPGGRRAFLDGLLGRVSARYALSLAQYERTLAQRNAALRHDLESGGEAAASGLEVWDARLAELGSELMRVRRRAVKRLAGLAAEAHRELAGDEKALSLRLIETAPLEDYLGALRSRRREELARGTTVIGPHRDDLELRLNDLATAAYASRGEARTVALALRKGEFDLLGEKFEEAPVLLIDDFGAELDARRRGFLLDLAGRAPQAIVTGTEPPPGAARLLEVSGGRILPIQGGPVGEGVGRVA